MPENSGIATVDAGKTWELVEPPGVLLSAKSVILACVVGSSDTSVKRVENVQATGFTIRLVRACPAPVLSWLVIN